MKMTRTVNLQNFEAGKWVFIFQKPVLMSNYEALGPNIFGWRNFIFGIVKFEEMPKEGESIFATKRKGIFCVIHYWLPWFIAK